jgi:hypothetical protein
MLKFTKKAYSFNNIFVKKNLKKSTSLILTKNRRKKNNVLAKKGKTKVDGIF